MSPSPSPRPTPPHDALPSSATLKRASLIAFGVVVLLGLGVVLPAETGRDPTGLGEVLGLREMGRIKVALAREVAEDEALGARGAPAAAMTPPATTTPAITSGAWRDSITVTLEPNRGIELKLTMQQGDTAYYRWTSDAAEVYYHRHGEPPNAPKDVAAHSYDKGMATADTGSLIAAFDGIHGWFFRNRSATPLRVTLQTRGTYAVLRAM